jgi:hypothetical protein
MYKGQIMTILEVQELTEADRAGITGAVLDYIEGWYESKPERTERSLHPTLAKRLVTADTESGENILQEIVIRRSPLVTPLNRPPRWPPLV